MIYQVEKAKSDKGKCRDCQNKIKQDTIRLVIADSHYGHAEFRYLCVECGRKLIEDEVDRLEKIYEGLI